MAGAIAPATAPHWDQDQPGAQSPRPAPAPPTAGASRPPGRALACVALGPADLRGTVPHGRGKRGSRFLIPPKGAIPVPGPGRFSRQAGGRIAFSAPCQGGCQGVITARGPELLTADGRCRAWTPGLRIASISRLSLHLPDDRVSGRWRPGPALALRPDDLPLADRPGGPTPRSPAAHRPLRH